MITEKELEEILTIADNYALYAGDIVSKDDDSGLLFYPTKDIGGHVDKLIQSVITLTKENDRLNGQNARLLSELTKQT